MEWDEWLQAFGQVVAVDVTGCCRRARCRHGQASHRQPFDWKWGAGKTVRGECAATRGDL